MLRKLFSFLKYIYINLIVVKYKFFIIQKHCNKKFILESCKNSFKIFFLQNFEQKCSTRSENSDNFLQDLDTLYYSSNRVLDLYISL